MIPYLSLTVFRNVYYNIKKPAQNGDYLKHYYYTLTKEQQKIYLILLKFLGFHSIPCKTMVSDIQMAMKALLMDYPELCFFEGKWAYHNHTVYPQYVLPIQSTQQLTAAARQIRVQLSAKAYPKQVYDWMLTHIKYNHNAENSQNAYGALVQRQAVCKGIAKGYQLLMQEQKIECILVEGTLDGRTKHVWNMIRDTDHWTHVDVTMGYPCFWSLTGASDSYGRFRKTSEELSRSHKIYHPEILPAE